MPAPELRAEARDPFLRTNQLPSEKEARFFINRRVPLGHFLFFHDRRSGHGFYFELCVDVHFCGLKSCGGSLTRWAKSCRFPLQQAAGRGL